MANIIEPWEAAALLKNGEVVAIPTETVYGLAANAYNKLACKKIYSLKGRPSYNPLIVHVSGLNAAKEIAYFNNLALELASQFWPGPISFVLPLKSKSIASEVTAGKNTIALRMPSNPTCLRILEKIDFPLAAPSANPSNYLSPTSYMQVKESFKGINLPIVSSKTSAFGLESTIIDLTTEKPQILRPGFITEADIISKIPNFKVFSSLEAEGDDKEQKNNIKSPGRLSKHYSPNTSIRTAAKETYDNELALNFGGSNLKASYSLNLSHKGDLIEAAGNLFNMLWRLDKFAASNNYHSIAIAEIPNTGIGVAINDKLKRAAN